MLLILGEKTINSSSYDIEYYRKDGQPTDALSSRHGVVDLGVSIHADDCPSNLRKAGYMRSAYRHTSEIYWFHRLKKSMKVQY